MSNHFDSITTTNHPKLDLTDAYIFKGNTGTVLIANSNTTLSENHTGSGWHTDALYDLHLTLGNQPEPDLTLRFKFSGHNHDDQNDHGGQRFTLTAHLGHANPESTGIMLLANAKTETIHNHYGTRVFAGRAGDPFYIAFPAVTAVRTALTTSAELDLGDFDPDTAQNAFAGQNVNTIAVELPNFLGLLDHLRVGYWATVTIPTDDGQAWRQIDRTSIPLTSTVYGFNESDDYNATRPQDDLNTWGSTVFDLTKSAVEANGTDADESDEYAEMVRDRLLPEMLHYMIGTDADVSQWNGRALDQGGSETMFQLVLNKKVEMGLTSEDATGELRDDFPYVAEPAE